MSEEKGLAVAEEKGISTFNRDEKTYEFALRQAKLLADSDMTPTLYKGKVPNCMIALDMASRTGTSVLAVMQNSSIIHGKFTWSATYVIALINACRKFDSLRFEMSVDGEVSVGNKKIQNQQCVAVATEIATGKILRGSPVSIAMAVHEKWYDRAGSKWQSMPVQMLKYRAATFFGREFVPELLLGMKDDSEVRDVGPDAGQAGAQKSKLNDRLKARKVEAEIVVEDEDGSF